MVQINACLWGILILGFVVAGFGVFNTLTMNVLEQTRELGLLRVVAMTRRQIRKTIKTRGHFPTEEAARKLIYLAINNAQKSWRQTYHWSSALLSFKIHFGDRLP